MQVQVLHTNEQFINCYVENSSGSCKAYVTVIYAKNTTTEITALWAALLRFGAPITGPWVLTGDFNSILDSTDRLVSPVTTTETQDFRNCLDSLLLSKVCFYSFCNKQQLGHRVYSRIYWVVGNYEWI